MGDENRITYNGVDLRTLGLYASGNNTFNSPKKDYETVSIPGRSGDLVFWNNRFDNVDISYNVIYLPTPLFSDTDTRTSEEKFRENIRAIRSTLLSPNGYVRIEDCYHPDEYRLGYFKGPLNLDAALLMAGKGTLTFTCRPERFLTSGEQYIGFDFNYSPEPVTITNPTGFPAKPIFEFSKIYNSNVADIIIENNSGSVQRKFVVNAKPGSSYYDVTMDCESMECTQYSQGVYTVLHDGVVVQSLIKVNNSWVNTGDYLMLYPGDNIISATGGDISGRVTPRWYTI